MAGFPINRNQNVPRHLDPHGTALPAYQTPISQMDMPNIDSTYGNPSPDSRELTMDEILAGINSPEEMQQFRIEMGREFYDLPETDRDKVHERWFELVDAAPEAGDETNAERLQRLISELPPHIPTPGPGGVPAIQGFQEGGLVGGLDFSEYTALSRLLGRDDPRSLERQMAIENPNRYDIEPLDIPNLLGGGNVDPESNFMDMLQEWGGVNLDPRVDTGPGPDREEFIDEVLGGGDAVRYTPLGDAVIDRLPERSQNLLRNPSMDTFWEWMFPNIETEEPLGLGVAPWVGTEESPAPFTRIAEGEDIPDNAVPSVRLPPGESLEYWIEEGRVPPNTIQHYDNKTPIGEIIWMRPSSTYELMREEGYLGDPVDINRLINQRNAIAAEEAAAEPETPSRSDELLDSLIESFMGERAQEDADLREAAENLRTDQWDDLARFGFTLAQGANQPFFGTAFGNAGVAMLDNREQANRDYQAALLGVASERNQRDALDTSRMNTGAELYRLSQPVGGSIQSELIQNMAEQGLKAIFGGDALDALTSGGSIDPADLTSALGSDESKYRRAIDLFRIIGMDDVATMLQYNLEAMNTEALPEL